MCSQDRREALGWKQDADKPSKSVSCQKVVVQEAGGAKR